MASWQTHYETQYRAQKRSMDAIAELMHVYEKLRQSEKVPSFNESSESAQNRQKTKQIESQQALLTDLQWQLGTKEEQLRDMTARFSLATAQANQLQRQLQSTHELLGHKSTENLQLRDEIAALQNCHVEVSQPNDPPKLSTDHLVLQLTHAVQLKANCDPNVLIAKQAKILVATRKVHYLSAGSLVNEFEVPSLSAMSMDLLDDCALIGTSEGQLCLLELNSGRFVKDLRGHGTSKVKGCGFLNSGTNKAFSVATDRTLKIWDLNRGSPIRSVPVVSQIVGGVANIDLIATGHQNGSVTLWSMTEKVCQIDNVHSESCLGVAISPDGRFLVSVGKDNTIAIIDINMAHAGPVHSIGGFVSLTTDNCPAVSPDSRIVSVCSKIGIQSWDIFTGSHLSTVHTDALALSWSSSQNASQQIVSAHPNGIVKWWTPS